MRRFGVEIEFGGSKDAVVAAVRAAGIQVDHHGYMGHSETIWVMKNDGSVSNGGEIVSPPLDFDDPAQRAQVDTVLNAMREAGARPIEQAGIHVHVEAADLDARQVAAVARCFTKFEDVLYRIGTSGWRRFRPGGYTFAPPMKQVTVDAMAKVRNRDQLSKAVYGRVVSEGQRVNHSDSVRYCGLNIHAWFYMKTIEFRLFNSSLNPKRVQCYIACSVALVEDARRGKSRSVNKAYRLGDMFEGKHNPDNALHRFLQVVRYEAGMSAEDVKLVRYCWKDSQSQPARAGL